MRESKVSTLTAGTTDTTATLERTESTETTAPAIPPTPIPTTTYVINTPRIIPLKERRPRIILEISKNCVKSAGEDTNGTNGLARSIADRYQPVSSNIKINPIHKLWEKKIEIMNSTTLAFQMKGNAPHEIYRRNLTFDCVANGETDPLIRTQIGALVDRLLINGKNNCCLLRVGPQRVGPSLQILSHYIIPELSKKIKSVDISPLLLYAIRIEYYDVRKYDVVNMILRTAPKNKPRHHITLRNTWELLQWVQDTYPTLWSQGAGHECLDLKFIFIRDQSGTKIRIKLSILHFFLNKMDAEMAAGFRNFLENNGSINSSRIKHSILTDYLREYFFSPENWYIWIFFRVPENQKGETISEMLRVASSAYAGVQCLVNGQIKTDTEIFKEFDAEDELCPIIKRMQTPSVSKFNTFIRSTRSCSTSQISSRFQTKEKQSLSYWYHQMDEKFQNVFLTMEMYYIRKHKPIKPEQNSELNKPKERREFISTVRNTPKPIVQPVNDLGLRSLLSNYKQAIVSLHTQIQQVEKSPFARLLKVFIETKSNELVQHLSNLREKNTPALRGKRLVAPETSRTARAKSANTSK